MRWLSLIALCALSCDRRGPRPVAPRSSAPVDASTLAPGDAGSPEAGAGPSALTLPRPFATPSASRPAEIVQRPASAELRVADGWRARLWASGLGRVRQITVASNGDVLATDSAAGAVILLRDGDGDGRADAPVVLAQRLELPFGIAIHPEGWLYVANTTGVVRWRYRAGDRALPTPPERIVALPGRGYNQHWTRSIAFSRDHQRLFVSVGSETNVEVEADPRRAAITVCAIDGSDCRVFASGLRNATGLAVDPASGALLAAVNERDELGDDLPPDYLTRVADGAFYGWPYAYWGRNEDPRRAGERPDLVARSVVPDFSLGAHAAPISVLFARALGGDALVSLHGSWNRSDLHGYEVLRVRFAQGVPTESSVFVSGWRLNHEKVWGRPAGMAETPRGSVLIVDDGSHAIYEIERAP
jgi:glucose/arabinose dehydrogenase